MPTIYIYIVFVCVCVCLCVCVCVYECVCEYLALWFFIFVDFIFYNWYTYYLSFILFISIGTCKAEVRPRIKELEAASQTIKQETEGAGFPNLVKEEEVEYVENALIKIDPELVD